MKEKHFILAARLISLIFTPFYLPLVGMAILFVFSYLSMLEWGYKATVLLAVYFFTVLLPTLLIRLYRRTQGWNLIELGRRERRMVPYIISIVCYFTCYYVMSRQHVPFVIGVVLLAALSIQIICAIINVWWKISTHSAAIGGIAGALVAFSFKFSFNPVWWLCLVFVIGGLVGSARMILRQHTLAQVVAGFCVGFISALHLIMRI